MKRLWYGFRFFLGWLLAALGSWSILRACQVIPSEEERETLRKALGKFGKLSDYSDQDIASHYWRSVRKNESDDYNKERYAGKRPKFLSHYTNEEISQEYLKRIKQRIDDNIKYNAFREAEKEDAPPAEGKLWVPEYENTSRQRPFVVWQEQETRYAYRIICPKCMKPHFVPSPKETLSITCLCEAKLGIASDGTLASYTPPTVNKPF